MTDKLYYQMRFSGTKIAAIEMGLFYAITLFFNNTFKDQFSSINIVSFYWLCFTILTGVWEWTYVNHKPVVRKIAQQMIKRNTHVWSLEYPLKAVIPTRLARIFYSEYAAYADREYMSDKDYWSRLIEGSHGLFCGAFSALSLVSKIYGGSNSFTTMASVAMGTQIMNSILYMGEYFIQVGDVNSVNHNNHKFPCGIALLRRPFMYINLFWIIMPTFVIGSLI